MHRKVANALNGAICVTGIGWQLSVSGLWGVVDGALGIAVGFGLIIGPFAMRLYRGGDAKLVMALGAFLGPRLTIWMFLWGAAFGGVLALVLLAFAGGPARRAMVNNLKVAAQTGTRPEVEKDRPARLHVPMAVAFAAGAIVAATWR